MSNLFAPFYAEPLTSVALIGSLVSLILAPVLFSGAYGGRLNRVGAGVLIGVFLISSVGLGLLMSSGKAVESAQEAWLQERGVSVEPKRLGLGGAVTEPKTDKSYRVVETIVNDELVSIQARYVDGELRLYATSPGQRVMELTPET